MKFLSKWVCNFFYKRSWPVLSSLIPSHLRLVHRGIMEQLHAEFTKSALAETDVHCERTACDSNGGIIPAGQRRYYVYPKLDKNGIAHGPGRWCCKKCYIYYRCQKDTVIRTTTVPGPQVTTTSRSSAPSPVPDVNSIRQSVNESQRQGKSFFL